MGGGSSKEQLETVTKVEDLKKSLDDLKISSVTKEELKKKIEDAESKYTELLTSSIATLKKEFELKNKELGLELEHLKSMFEIAMTKIKGSEDQIRQLKQSVTDINTWREELKEWMKQTDEHVKRQATQTKELQKQSTDQFKQMEDAMKTGYKMHEENINSLRTEHRSLVDQMNKDREVAKENQRSSDEKFRDTQRSFTEKFEDTQREMKNQNQESNTTLRCLIGKIGSQDSSKQNSIQELKLDLILQEQKIESLSQKVDSMSSSDAASSRHGAWGPRADSGVGSSNRSSKHARRPAAESDSMGSGHLSCPLTLNDEYPGMTDDYKNKLEHFGTRDPMHTNHANTSQPGSDAPVPMQFSSATFSSFEK